MASSCNVRGGNTHCSDQCGPIVCYQGNTVTCDIIHEHDGRDMGDKEYFAIIRGAMKVLNFQEEEMWDIWRIVAIIMHLGNVCFGGV